MRKKVAWFAINTAWWGLAAADIFGGQEWAGNVFGFVTVALLVVTLGVALIFTIMAAGFGLDDLDRDDIPERSVPAAWSWSYDLAGIVMIAGAGWFWLATAVLVQAWSQHWMWACLRGVRRQLDQGEDQTREAAA